ncbi:MAGUK p55 sub member 6 [Homalodisca vitripennis]|nr:MAGUK p55 sub member 6 [Homalodisca vitripennis]
MACLVDNPYYPDDDHKPSLVRVTKVMNHASGLLSFQVQDQLEVPHKLAPDPVGSGSLNLANELQRSCQIVHSQEAQELDRIFHKPHFKALLETHDTIAEKSYNGHESNNRVRESRSNSKPEMNTQPIRIVGLRKIPNEPLGFTVQVDENGNLVVARVLAGGVIERQGLLHPGDVILEVNSVNVSSPDELQFEVNKAKENVTLRIAPNTDNLPSLKTHQCYMRALFDYEPKDDSLLPCREIGLPFKHGDILQCMYNLQRYTQYKHCAHYVECYCADSIRCTD